MYMCKREELHEFTEESLDTLDRDDIIKSITKRFGVDIQRGSNSKKVTRNQCFGEDYRYHIS